MVNETRKFTDEQIKEVFKRTKKTADKEIIKIEYEHFDLFPDRYLVFTADGIKYSYRSTQTQQHNYSYEPKAYDRIVKLKK